MRLKRLVLARYGHLADVAIEFPAEPGLHVVLGPNEAGKSTALAAIGDALFRFPHRSPYDFRHGTRELRLEVELEGRDGRVGSFIRRKGRKDDLTDAAGVPAAETAIASFLGGATRERFETVFGLDGARLRDGGQAMLDGKGEAGSAIMSAYAGVVDYRHLAQRIEDQAGQLFGDRRGNRQFHAAVRRFHDARQQVEGRRVAPEVWNEKVAERNQLEQALAVSAAQKATLEAERIRLNRIRGTTPARRRLVALAGERAGLGEVPDLPQDAQTTFDKLVKARDTAGRDLERESKALADLDERLARLPAADPVLGAEATIDQLADARVHVEAALRDRETLRAAAARHEAAMLEEATELGIAADAEALLARRPDALARADAEKALKDYERLRGRLESAEDAVVKAEEADRLASAALDAMKEVAQPTALREAIDAVKAEGRLEINLDEARRAHQAAEEKLARALGNLPFWEGDCAALAALIPPLGAVLDHAADILAKAREAEADAAGELDEIERRLVSLAAEAAAAAVAGEPPTLEMVVDARVRRDRAWAALRRAWLDGGAPPSEEESLLLGADPAAGYEALVRRADDLADRRSSDLQRAMAAEQRRRDKVEQDTLRVDAELRLGTAAARREVAETGWRALWRGGPVAPGEPAAMREWLLLRGQTLERQADLTVAATRYDDLAHRRRAALDGLAGVLPSPSPEDETLAARLRRAEALCRTEDKRVADQVEMRRAAAAAASTLANAQQVLERRRAEIAQWIAGSWATSAAALLLPPGADPSVGATALTQWTRIDEEARKRRDARERVAQMSDTIDDHGARAAAIVAVVAPDLVGLASPEAVRVLAGRLASARDVETDRAGLQRQHADAAAKIEESTRTLAHAEDGLADLFRLAAVEDAEAMRDTLARWTEREKLDHDIAREEAGLRALDDGMSLAELSAEAEAAGLAADAIPARIEEIGTELQAIHGAELASTERLTVLRGELQAMEAGQDAAAARQDEAMALADIDEVVRRYPPLRMAHTFLRAGLERFRQQQQGPLLARAGTLFGRLTEGRYDRLEVDEDEDGSRYVVAHQADGASCRVDHLSEGTIDQLYLALRLAALEGEAEFTEPLPFIADDLLVNFDNQRALAAMHVLAEFSRTTQVILFTHHDHIADIARSGLASLTSLGLPG